MDMIPNRKEFHIELPEKVAYILDTLSTAGFEAYAVGGCVRDSLLGRLPNDWDITTNALPSQVKALFRRTIDTGIQHGTVTVMLKKDGFEVTTYRVDGDYSDGRHPDSVEFSSSLEEDLKRRDFTINAMAYNDWEGLVDLYDGIGDLQAGRIRCVGLAEERFSEDALRLLRAVRFSAQLGFTIEEETARAIRKLAPTIARVSRERIHTELGKLLTSKHPEYMLDLYELGLLKTIFPEYNGTEELPIIGKMLAKMAEDRCNQDLPLAYAAFFYPLGEKETGRVMKNLKLDNMTIDRTVNLVEGFLKAEPRSEKAALRRQASELGPSLYTGIEYLAEIHADAHTEEGWKSICEAWKAEETLFQEILRDEDPLTVRELAVTGNDLIAAGVKPGKELGQLLQQLLEMVLEDPSKNVKETLLSCI